MRRLLVAIALAASCALVFTLSVQAQEKGAKEHSMTGCLQKGTDANSYLVTNLESAEGKGPKNIGIVESTANLAPHVGHKITVTGTAVPPKEAESAKTKPPKAEHYMKITAVKMVSATCP